MGRLTRQILPLIERERPDIITAQEIFSVDKPVVFPDTTFDLCDRIKTVGEFPYIYFSPTWDMTVADATTGFGNAIFSKYPLESTEVIFTHGEFQPNITAETYVPNARNAQFVKVLHGSGAFWVVNHHAYWEPTPIGSEKNVMALQRVADKIRSLEALPIVFAGDLNVIPDAPAMRVFDDLLTDLTATHAIQTTLSELGKVPNVPCDHVLINEKVEVVKFQVLGDLVSDHKALVLEFTLS